LTTVKSSGEQSGKFVLILSSYTYETEWSTALAKEISSKLQDVRSDVEISITYADISGSTSMLADRFAMQGAFSYGRLSALRSIPDVLVLIGDESWMLYRIMDLRGKWEQIPVVLSGMHSEIMHDYSAYFAHRQIPDSTLVPLSETLGTFRAAVVTEPDNTRRTLQLISQLHPDCTQLYFLSEGTYSDAYTYDRLLRAIHAQAPHLTLTELLYTPDRMDAVNSRQKRLPRGSVLLTNGVNPRDFAPEIPVITLRDMSYTHRIPQGGYFATTDALAAKSVEAVLTFLNEQVPVQPYTTAADTAFYLNRTALMHANLNGRARLVPYAISRNIPPSFVMRHTRKLFAGMLMVIILGFIIFRTISSHLYQRSLRRLFTQYKSLYDEYLSVYENMPIGVMLFDPTGKLLQTNTAATELLPDESLRQHIFHNSRSDRTIDWNGYSYYIILRRIASENDETQDNLLFIVVDYTEMEKMRKDKERIYNVFNFAMNSSGIGVASYNLIDRVGFATNAWYQLQNLKQTDRQNFIEHPTLLTEDRKRVQQYLKKVRYGVSQPFLQNVRIIPRSGETHFLRCYIKPLEYFPQEGCVTVAEIIVNMDAKVRREFEIKEFIKKAQANDRLKHAFVANIRDDILQPWRNIAVLSEELLAVDDLPRRATLYQKIETNNETLLELIRQFIDASLNDSLNAEIPPSV
jgi:PAS domain-containing protein